MMKLFNRRLIASLVLLFFFPLFADEVSLVEQHAFTRETGKPFVESVDFAAPGVAGEFKISIYNGGLSQEYFEVSAANVWLNNQLIFTKNDFNQQISYLEHTVTLLELNTLSVEIESKPGSTLIINVGGIIQNRSPVIASPAPVEALEDSTYKYQVTATDPDALNTLSYTLLDGPSGMSIDSTLGLLTWLPLQGDVGQHSVSLQVSDTEGGSTTQHFNLAVSNTNDAPVISSQPLLSVLEDESYVYQVVVSDEDIDEVLSFALQTAPSEMLIDSTSGLIQWTPLNEDVGTTLITVVVSDDENASVEQSFSLNIININDQPNFSSVPVINSKEDELYSYVLSATDVDAGDALSFTLLSGPLGMTLDTFSTTLEWTPEQQDVGEHTVELEVADVHGLSEIQTFTLTIENINDAPVLPDIATSAIKATEYFSLQIEASDEDGDPLTYSLVNGPLGMTVATDTGLLEWTPSVEQLGEVTVEISARDAEITSTTTFTITVEPPPYSAPEFIGDSQLVGFVNEDFTYQLQIEAAVEYSLELTSAPSGLTLDTSTGQIAWPAMPAGQYEFTVRAFITEALSTTRAFTISSIEKEQSHEGTDFWLAFSTNHVDSVEANLFVYISSEFDTTGTLTIPLQGISIPFSISAGSLTRVDLDPEQWAKSTIFVAQDKGIHITTEHKSVVYALNQKQESTDGFLVLPTDTLGKVYRAMTYEGGQITFVATKDNTQVDLVLSEDILRRHSNNERYSKGETHSFTLNEGEAYVFSNNLYSGGSMAGSVISSSHPIAIFSGNYCVNVPTSIRACDHLVEQMIPVHSLGQRFLTTPFAMRFGGDLVRIIATFDDTRVVVNGEYLDTINAGEWLDDTFNVSSVLETNHPVLAAQFSKGLEIDYEENQAFGDPFMLMLTPEEQMVSRYQFTTTDRDISYNFVNVIADQTALNDLMMDGAAVDLNAFNQIGSTQYYAAQIQVQEGAHILESTEPFIATIYGYGSAESYGYQGGLNLPRFSDSDVLSVTASNNTPDKGNEVCLDIMLSNNDLPIISARVDVFADNTAAQVYHYLTDDEGKATHCHFGLAATEETLVIQSGAQSTTELIQWQQGVDLQPQPPTFISAALVSAPVGKTYLYMPIAADVNLNETLSYSLLSGPAGMQFEQGVLVWAPSESELGEHIIEIEVSDLDGLTDTQSFTLNTMQGNSPPSFGVALHDDIAYVGHNYLQRLDDLSDPDDDVVYCEILDNPVFGNISNELVPQGCFAMIQKTPTAEHIGTHLITVRLWDRTGQETLQSFTLKVVQNNEPVLAQAPAQYARVGMPYSSIIQINDLDDDTLSYSISRIEHADTGSVSGVPSFTIDSSTGEITLTPTADHIGTFKLYVRVYDIITLRNFTVFITISGEDEPFTTEVNVSPQFIQSGDTVTLSTDVKGALGDVIYAVTVNDVPLTLSEDNTVQFADTETGGIYNVEVTATDATGTTIGKNYFAVALDDDTDYPMAQIDNISADSIVTGLTDIQITASDENIAAWSLYLYSNSAGTQGDAVASGNSAVAGQSIYTFDPSLIANGLYHLELNVVDINGNQSTDAIVVQVDGNLKVGNFTYTVDEFTVPLAGLPISIRRTYDSRRKSELGDFGYGWNLDYNLVKTEKSRALGAGWQLNDYPSGPLGVLRDYCVESQGDVLVNVTLPNDEVERFKVKASPECNLGVPAIDVELTFEPVGDTQSTLTLEQTQTVRLVGDQLEILGTTATFDDNEFVLTTREGYQYNFVANDDVTLVTDPNGNTLTFSDTGIVHSSGKSITFGRNAKGNISWIKRPDGKPISYLYNAIDDLTQVRWPDNDTRENYTYTYRHGLLTIADTDGNSKVRNIYDDDGRLIAQEDNEGNRTSFAHDLTDKESVVTDRNGNISFFYYDPRGNVTSMVDALGHTTSYTYDANDNQLTETDPLGNVTTRTYNANNDVLSVTDPEGNVVSYTYNTRGQESTITDAKGNVYTNTYDLVGNLLSVQDPLENRAGNNINAQGLVTLTQDMLGNQTSYTYDTQGNKTNQIDAEGGDTSYTYDADNRLLTETLSRTDAAGEILLETTTYTYDSNGRVTNTADGLGVVEIIGYDGLWNINYQHNGLVAQTFTYDVYNRLTNTTYDGVSDTTTYDAEGNKLTYTDRNGHVTTFEYDELNRLVNTLYPDGAVQTVEYDAAGRVSKDVDENGHASAYTYDKAGRRTSMTDALGNITSFEYDANSNLTKEIDALSRETTYTYDTLDRRLSMTLADATLMQDSFDAAGRNTAKTDQAGKTTSYEYDGLGRLTKVTDALSQVTEYQYDEAGNKVAQVDAQGRTTKWDYDSRGRITARELPLGQRESFSYDLADNVASHTNFNGQILYYSYRRQTGRLSGIRGTGISESYVYDDAGNRTGAQSVSDLYTYQYDSRHRLITETQPDGTILAYSYDDVGNKTSLVTTYKNDDIRTELYAYDALNRLTSVTDNQPQTTTFEYDAVGNQTHINYPNGLVSISAYDGLNRVTSITTQDANENILSSYVYGLDVTGRRSALTEHTGRTSTFTYDDVYRLTQESIVDATNGDHNSSYVYDATGNRTQSIINGIATAYVYDANDRLLSQGALTYTYDEQGNMLTESDGVTNKTYTYNAENQLTGFTDGTITTLYRYTPDDIRVSKTVDGTTTNYVVDSNREYAQVIAEQDSSDVIQKEYVYGYDLISQVVGNDTSFFHYDSLGTTRDLSDSAGLFSDSYLYDAFGELLAETGTTDNNYRYTGEQYDAELDNYYLRARYYNQGMGRFTQMDSFDGWEHSPITLHKYLYGNADSVNHIDPSGHFSLGELGATIRVIGIQATQSVARVGNSATRAILKFGKTAGRFGKTSVIRVQYMNRVSKLRNIAAKMKSNGKSAEEIAKVLNRKRRALGRLFKNATDAETQHAAFARNMQKYGDKWGPTWQYLRGQGKSWEEIAESAAKPNSSIVELIKIFFTK
jgi:RHS repeat-associated protein